MSVLHDAVGAARELWASEFLGISDGLWAFIAHVRLKTASVLSLSFVLKGGPAKQCRLHS